MPERSSLFRVSSDSLLPRANGLPMNRGQRKPQSRDTQNLTSHNYPEQLSLSLSVTLTDVEVRVINVTGYDSAFIMPPHREPYAHFLF